MLLTTTRRSPSRRSAFTLMEVLVVVAILVILAGVAIIAVPRYLEDAKKSKAHLTAKSLAQSCEAYRMSASNPTQSYPDNPQQELVTPPFGSSFLQNGQQDLITPWNQPWVFEFPTNAQGVQYPYVHTVSPDGTPVSNFGVGMKAAPPY